MSDLAMIGANLSSYLVQSSPQTNNCTLQWYVAGSLATITMASAESVIEIELDENNKIIGKSDPKYITEGQRRKISKFSRKLGVDIDVVNVNGDLIKGSHFIQRRNSIDGSIMPESTLGIQHIREKVPGILDLMSWSGYAGGTMYLDKLDDKRTINHHRVAIIRTQKGDIYVTAPPEQLAHKLAETIFFSNTLAGKNAKPQQRTKYEKDIRDLATMFYGFKDLYEKQEFLDRIYLALNEKQDSLFSIHNPRYNCTNAIRVQEILEQSIISRIVNDSTDYLRSITDDNSDVELSNFLNNLLERRRTDVKNFMRPQPTNSTKQQEGLEIVE